jgi:hypothetical protein
MTQFASKTGQVGGLAVRQARFVCAVQHKPARLAQGKPAARHKKTGTEPVDSLNGRGDRI